MQTRLRKRPFLQQPARGVERVNVIAARWPAVWRTCGACALAAPVDPCGGRANSVTRTFCEIASRALKRGWLITMGLTLRGRACTAAQRSGRRKLARSPQATRPGHAFNPPAWAYADDRQSAGAMMHSHQFPRALPPKVVGLVYCPMVGRRRVGAGRRLERLGRAAEGRWCGRSGATSADHRTRSAGGGRQTSVTLVSWGHPATTGRVTSD